MGRQRKLKQQRRHLAAALTPEQRAAAIVLEERARRVDTCFQEVTALLQRHGCGFTVDLIISMQPGSSQLHGRYQLTVIALDGSSLATPIAPPGAAGAAPADPVSSSGKGTGR